MLFLVGSKTVVSLRKKLNPYLILFNVFNCKIEPEPSPGSAGVWSDVQIILQVCDMVCSSQVPTLKRCVETQLSTFGLPTLPRRTNDQPTQIAQTSFSVAFFTICKYQNVSFALHAGNACNCL